MDINKIIDSMLVSDKSAKLASVCCKSETQEVLVMIYYKMITDLLEHPTLGKGGQQLLKQRLFGTIYGDVKGDLKEEIKEEIEEIEEKVKEKVEKKKVEEKKKELKVEVDKNEALIEKFYFLVKDLIDKNKGKKKIVIGSVGEELIQIIESFEGASKVVGGIKIKMAAKTHEEKLEIISAFIKTLV